MRPPSRPIAALLAMSLALACTLVAPHGGTAAGGPESLQRTELVARGIGAKRVRAIAGSVDRLAVGALGPAAELGRGVAITRPPTAAVRVATLAPSTALPVAATSRPRCRAPPHAPS